MPHIVIAGAGFAACTAIKTLRKKGFNGKISLVAPRAELFYYPSLIWVPPGKRNHTDLIVPLHDYLERKNVNYIQSKVTGIDTSAKSLKLENDSIDYDAVIIASGGRYIRKLPGIEHAKIACSGWEDTKGFSDKLAAMNEGTIAFGFSGNPNEPSAMRGGPVFEFLFGVDTMLRQQGRREKFNLVFFSPAPKPGKRMGEKAVDKILAEMKKRNIKTYLGKKMKRFTENSVETEKETFKADLILFIPGMTGPDWAINSGLSLSEGGFFKANEFCQVEGEDAVFVAGDAGSFPGPDWKPKQAHMADLQAEAAAKNILEVLHLKKVRHTFKTELICIVDTLTNASMVYRGSKRGFMMKMPPLHWVKVFYEKMYLKAYIK
ncbi:MAG: FAD-dependent oxidoreductase [Gammaproteobacteria bacterium]|jgi:sulfide:quinone oxidoreductase|nr:FAD-dependent oxidoreductase [Gammaproteobacteria bacterium]MBT3722395.1 FAD-dependent oxidoreductase [Gammaproteobacteria bacterium]MBT4075295.1 FAD-dependent oxidoreductase [Gammaproteobacteria bacterium]MBT4196203.1 FAD-dependent oxidoreductase [Gammaproteobacteria bacterium]MBT4861237.1 FAD-dependent oxidoreductase [Gammaproteobacteria bacterium]